MNWTMSFAPHKRRVITVGLVLLILAVIGLCMHVYAQADIPEVALKLGEPWEDMRKRSSAKIDTAEPGHYWGVVVLGDARMRFIDSQYGFTTPRAKFFAVAYDQEKVSDVRMSPQVETLPLDEALKVAIDLQDQWERGGWKLGRSVEDTKIEDTAQWRKDLQDCKSNAIFWRVPGLYQTQLNIACFDDSKHPKEKRYLITLELAKPYGGPDDDGKVQQEVGK